MQSDPMDSHLDSCEEVRWLEAVKNPLAIRIDGVRLLLAEDSPDNQRLFARILTMAGAIVDVVNDGEGAVRIQSKNVYDVIVMDIRMPILDGYQATRRIREQGFKGPIVALTAHANPGEEQRCRDSGCSHFYLKPIDRRSLLLAVKDAVAEFSRNAQSS